MGLMVKAALGYLAIFVFTGCSSRQPTSHIHYVIPDGYLGIFTVSYSSAAKRDRTSHIRVIVPKTGQVELLELGVLQDWYIFSGSYHGGGHLPDSPAQGLGIFALSTNEKGETMYLIGTSKERDKFYLSNRKSQFPWRKD